MFVLYTTSAHKTNSGTEIERRQSLSNFLKSSESIYHYPKRHVQFGLSRIITEAERHGHTLLKCQ